ncbi:hypothetical protein Hanom_Chr02g00156331 [Helianthus anomalus]
MIIRAMEFHDFSDCKSLLEMMEDGEFMFKYKHLVGIETKTWESNFLFTRGIGAVEIRSGNETLRIQSVFYAPEIDRNVLSLDQLTLQGYTVKRIW